jgi:hypothetical protein
VRSIRVEAVLERGDEQVRDCVVGLSLRRPTAEQVLVELHHRVGDLDHQQPAALLFGAGLLSGGFGVHVVLALSSSEAEAARKEENENQAAT